MARGPGALRYLDTGLPADCVTLSSDANLAVLDAGGGVRDVMARGGWHVRKGTPIVHETFERVEW